MNISLQARLRLCAFAVAGTLEHLPCAAQNNPLYLSELGYLECMNPNRLKKTCEGLTRYEKSKTNTFKVYDTQIWSSDPLIFFKTASAAMLVGRNVCTTIDEAIFKSAIFYKDGETLPDSEQVKLGEQYFEWNKDLIGLTSCMALDRYPDDKGNFQAQFYLQGEPLERGDGKSDTVIWIRPQDNYRIAPQ